MEYNEEYLEDVYTYLNLVISNVKDVKSYASGITIPIVFEKKEDVTNIIEFINNFTLDELSEGIERIVSNYGNVEQKAMENSTSYSKTEEQNVDVQYSQDDSIARYIQAVNNRKAKEDGEIVEHKKQKEFDELDKRHQEQKKYINEKYSNEVQILLEELNAEAQYSHDASMEGYIQAMNNGDVKKVGKILDNLIKQGKRTIIDKEIVIAQCIHNYLESNSYEYHSTDLIGLYPTFDESKDSKEYKRVSSATYVFWVLNELGYIKVIDKKEELTDSDLTSNQYSNYMHSANDLNALLEKKEGTYFEKVKDITAIKPGDILYYEDEDQGQIEIYAGNDNSGNWVVFSCGSNAWINYAFPTARDNDGKDKEKRKPTTVWRIMEEPKTPEENANQISQVF